VFGDVTQTRLSQTAPSLTAYIQDSGLVADEPGDQTLSRCASKSRPSRVTRRITTSKSPHLADGSRASDRAAPPTDDQQPSRYPTWKTTTTLACFSERTRVANTSGKTQPGTSTAANYRLARRPSDVPTLISGHFLTLSEHTQSRLETTCGLVISLHHEGNTAGCSKRVRHQRRQRLRWLYARATATSSPPRPGSTFPPPANHRKPKVLHASRRRHRPRRRKKSTATIRPQSRCSFTGTREVRATIKRSCWLRSFLQLGWQ